MHLWAARPGAARDARSTCPVDARRRTVKVRMVLAALAVGLLLGAQEAKKEDAVKEELKKLEGTWIAKSLVMDGKEEPNVEEKKILLIITGEKFKVSIDDMDLSEGTVVIDPSKKPKTIDLKYTAGPNKDKVEAGIYELDGDNLKTNFTQPAGNTERAKEFTSKEGSNLELITFKRKKKVDL
jgi:uncharacterized protein (TIGR03067 family)